MVLHFGYSTKIVNVTPAFLYGDLEEEYMECPQGMSDVTKNNCILLNKCIYSLIQAAWQYYKKAVEILKCSCFVGGSIGPCLYVKKSTKSIIYIALHVDDNLMVGNIAMINDAIEALRSKGLIQKIVEGLQYYLSCKIKFSNNKNHAWLGQHHLTKNLENKVGGLVNHILSHKNHSNPKFLITRPTEEIEKISIKDNESINQA